jgi:hypothetical protein
LKIFPIEPKLKSCYYGFMPKGPQGQKRPGDVIGAAIKIAKIATGEIEEKTDGKEYARKGGLVGGKIRADKLTKARKKEIAQKAAKARWAKK